MTNEDLDKLSAKLNSRRDWLTEERTEVCREIGKRYAEFFRANI